MAHGRTRLLRLREQGARVPARARARRDLPGAAGQGTAALRRARPLHGRAHTRWQDRLTVAQKTQARAVSCPAGYRPIAAPGGHARPVRQGLVHSAFVTVPIALLSGGDLDRCTGCHRLFYQGLHYIPRRRAWPGHTRRPRIKQRKAPCGESAGSLDAAEAGSGPGQGARPRGPRPRTGCPLTHGHVQGGERTVGAWKAAQAIQTGTHSCRCEGVAYGRINAQPCIIFHDSASTFISQRQLLRNLFMETHRARSPKLFYPAKMAATEHMRSDYLVLRVFGAAA
jgi:hypothetical protein